MVRSLSIIFLISFLLLFGCGGKASSPCDCQADLPCLPGGDASCEQAEDSEISLFGDSDPDAAAELQENLNSESSQEDGGDEAQAAVLTFISSEKLHNMLENKDFLLINVHSPDGNQILKTDAYFLHTDVDGMTAFIGDDLDEKVVVYCYSGFKASLAGQSLVDQGYRNIMSHQGGMRDWQAKGYGFE